MKNSKGDGLLRTRWVQKLLRYPVFAILSHWCFQGFFYMDWGERIFKVVCELIFFGIFFPLFAFQFDYKIVLLLSLLLVHSLNFLFNGQLWCGLKHFGVVSNSKEKFDQYLGSLEQRVRLERSIRSAYLAGGLVDENWNSASDIDIRVIRDSGWANWFRSCLFALFERSRALFARFPLDLYVIDPSNKFRNKELQTHFVK